MSMTEHLLFVAWLLPTLLLVVAAVLSLAL